MAKNGKIVAPNGKNVVHSKMAQMARKWRTRKNG